MKKRLAVVLLMSLIFAISGQPRAFSELSEARQDRKADKDNAQTVSKAEILAMLKQVEARQLSQADIVAAVEQRGIGFAVDEKTLNEFKEAGARVFLLGAIQRAVNKPVEMIVPASAEGLAGEDATAREAALARLPIIEQARYRALEYATELPDFIAKQTVYRYVQTSGTSIWKLLDTLEIELSYSEKEGEQFKVLSINGKPTGKSFEQLDGSTSTGEFGVLLTALFLPSTKTAFKEIRRELFRGRQTMLFDFSVQKVNSNSYITDRETGKKIVAAYEGSLWVDMETKEVLRIESANTGMPADFPITLSEGAVEYDWVRIDGRRHLLPARAELILGRDRERQYMRNVIEFRDYRKFEAKIEIK